MNQHAWPHKTNAGERLYVIGDIHGQYQHLLRLHDRIRRDLAERPVSKYRIICLGDLIDRGEYSRDVIDFLMQAVPLEPWTVLRGNHEDMLLRCLAEPDSISDWCRYGGTETLMSFGVLVPPIAKERNFKAISSTFFEKLGFKRYDFISQLPYSIDSGSYFFCHAGVKPNMPLADQSPNDLMWIRDEFLQYSGAFEKYIVHGHTPIDAIDIRPHRINIDTGAYITGRLSCLVLEDVSGYVFNSRELEFTSIF